MISGPLKWYTVAETLRGAMHTALSATSGGPPARSCVVPGAIAWDECDCGLLALSVARVFFTDNFPSERVDLAGGQCAGSFEAAEIVIQIVRCAPNPEGQELAPTCAALDAVARQTAEDVRELMRTSASTLCAMKANQDIVEYIVGVAEAQGPEGGCVGWELRVTVGLEAD